MLGTVADAEDMVQDTFLALQKIKIQQIRNLKAYLCKMITHRCLDELKSAKKKREIYTGPWLPEPILIEEEQDTPLKTLIHRESLSIAFLTLLEKLTPQERAVFILREVLEFQYSEIAEMLGKTETNCRQILSRAKGKIAAGKPEPAIDYAEQQKLLNDFIQAVTTENKERLLTLLETDIILYSDGGGKVPAALHPIAGAERVIPYLLGLIKKVPAGFRYQLANINGRPGVILWVGQQVDSILSFKTNGSKMAAFYLIRNPDKLGQIRRRIDS
jgi:RNA polymerase sigma-70 factor (ECF subfamily)